MSLTLIINNITIIYSYFSGTTTQLKFRSSQNWPSLP